MESGKILLIEDEPHNARLIEISLRPLGLDIVTSPDGVSGLEAARDRAVRAIVLDIAMPRMDGWEVLRRLRRDPATGSVPVVVLTAHAGDAFLLQAVDIGAQGFLTKPFVPDNLRALVAAVIDEAEARPAGAAAG